MKFSSRQSTLNKAMSPFIGHFSQTPVIQQPIKSLQRRGAPRGGAITPPPLRIRSVFTEVTPDVTCHFPHRHYGIQE